MSDVTTGLERCERCGASVEADDAYCRQCGGRLMPALAGGAAAALLPWIAYPVLSLAAATGVYFFLEGRQPSAAEQGLAQPASPPTDSGMARADASRVPQADASSAEASSRSPRRRRGPIRNEPTAKGRSSAPIDAAREPRSHEFDARGAPEPGAASRDVGAGKQAKVDAGLSPREVARARVNADVINYVVNRNRIRLRRCLERLTKKGLAPSGLVEIHLSVGQDGRALSAKVHENTTSYPSLGQCIAHEMARWRYPRPAGGHADLIYPFRFSAGK